MTDLEKQRALEGAILGFLAMGALSFLTGVIPRKEALKYTLGATIVGAGAGWLHAKTTEDLSGLFGAPKAQLATKGVW